MLNTVSSRPGRMLFPEGDTRHEGDPEGLGLAAEINQQLPRTIKVGDYVPDFNHRGVLIDDSNVFNSGVIFV